MMFIGIHRDPHPILDGEYCTLEVTWAPAGSKLSGFRQYPITLREALFEGLRFVRQGCRVSIVRELPDWFSLRHYGEPSRPGGLYHNKF